MSDGMEDALNRAERLADQVNAYYVRLRQANPKMSSDLIEYLVRDFADTLVKSALEPTVSGPLLRTLPAARSPFGE